MTGRGSPRRIGTSGAPSTSSGGATDIRMKCCNMCAERRKSSSASIGDASAIHNDSSPREEAYRAPHRKLARTRGLQRAPSAQVQHTGNRDPDRRPNRKAPRRQDSVRKLRHSSVAFLNADSSARPRRAPRSSAVELRQSLPHRVTHLRPPARSPGASCRGI